MQTGDAFIIVYAITDRSSFLHASELRIQLRREREADRTPIILVGNKCDLVRCREVAISGKYIVKLLNVALLLSSIKTILFNLLNLNPLICFSLHH